MTCPHCQGDMEDGYLAFYEALLPISRIVWQRSRPGYVRMRQPQGSVTVIRAPFFGRGDPAGAICRSCRYVAFRYSE